MTPEALTDALDAALGADGKAIFYPYVPSVITPPSVIVAPGEPFLEPGTHGTVEERWDVLVAFNPAGPDRGLPEMRRLALLVRSAASKAGAVWVQTHAPRKASPEANDLTAVAVTEVRFKYPA